MGHVSTSAKIGATPALGLVKCRLTAETRSSFPSLSQMSRWQAFRLVGLICSFLRSLRWNPKYLSGASPCWAAHHEELEILRLWMQVGWEMDSTSYIPLTTNCTYARPMAQSHAKS